MLVHGMMSFFLMAICENSLSFNDIVPSSICPLALSLSLTLSFSMFQEKWNCFSEGGDGLDTEALLSNKPEQQYEDRENPDVSEPEAER